ncbi:putative ribonuclease H protein [Nymphaea thermarum]|nr:putative ribonuclease H protein [Nymphaea thermarum]
MELAARYLKRQIIKRAIHISYSVRAIPDVHCLMFVDDPLLFNIASVKSITNIKRVLSQLEERMRFIINNSKSSLSTFNVDTPLEQRLANIGGWQAVKLPLDYLGVPLFTRNLNVNICACLIAKFKKKMAHWKTQLLSYAERTCLITHSMSSMDNFWMQSFSLPNEVLKKLERCKAGFLWADTQVNKHIHQIVWHSLCKPKVEGGIGLRLLEEVNELKRWWECFGLLVAWVNHMVQRNPSSSMASAPSKDPYPYNLNIANFVSIKLNQSNFLLWQTQMMGLIEIQDMTGFLDGEYQPPAQFLTALVKDYESFRTTLLTTMLKPPAPSYLEEKMTNEVVITGKRHDDLYVVENKGEGSDRIHELVKLSGWLGNHPNKLGSL